MHLYKMTYWNNNGNWYCNDVQDISGPSAKWYVPMRILNLSIEEYITLLVDTFHAKDLSYYEPTDYLHFRFLTEKDVKAFCSYVNKAARKRSFVI